MKNNIINQYVSALNKVIGSASELTTRQVSRNLIKELRSATSSDLVLSALNEVIERKNSTYAISISLLNRLSGWHTHLKQITDLVNKAIERLIRFPITKQNKAIHTFLIALLYNEKISLHANAGSLLHVLNDEKLEDIFFYILQSPFSPIPRNAPQGSFYSIPIVSQDHCDCVQFLCNIAARNDFGNELFSKANTLLQSALMIHYELSLEEEIVKEIESPRVDTGSACSLM